MAWIVANIDTIMIISGLLTLTMLYAALAPQAALRATFGEAIEGPLAEIVVRNWGALVGLIGAMLIYGALADQHRSFVLVVAGASKLVFIALVLSQGARYLRRQAGVAVIVDAVMITLFAVYLTAA